MAKIKRYMVLACTKCGRFLLASSDSETRTCAYCGKRVQKDGARIIARSDSAKEARKILQEAKTKERPIKSGLSEDGR
ncbi:MAG TPA: DUF1922 domain-containing protein [Candidatus Acidoferrales bacterium]|nr:DUF1922 domain-containing protein [Candidatus Acidoferrales bacterium]